MKDFDMLCTLEGSDIPEFFSDLKTQTCCIIFKGDFVDLNMIEDYLLKKSYR